MNQPQQRESIRRKRSSRMAAVQALYSYAISERKPTTEKLVQQLIDQWGESVGIDIEWPSDDKPEQAMLRDIVGGVVDHLTDVDNHINGTLKETWKPERMDPVLIALLRCAVFELAYKTDRKIPVIVDEYVTIASGYFEGNELGFVHSALQQLVAKLRPESPAP